MKKSLKSTIIKSAVDEEIKVLKRDDSSPQTPQKPAKEPPQRRSGKQHRSSIPLVTPEKGPAQATTEYLPTRPTSAVPISIVSPAERTPSKPTHKVPTSPVSSIKKEFATARDTQTPTKRPTSRRPSIAVVSPTAANKSSLVIPKSVDKVYKIVRKATGALGGNGHTGRLASAPIPEAFFIIFWYRTGAIYGELTMASMQKVLNFMVSDCELDEKSRMIDVGCGLGKPNFHAAESPGVRLSLGVELEELRYKVTKNR
jgi:hypothetical protein